MSHQQNPEALSIITRARWLGHHVGRLHQMLANISPAIGQNFPDEHIARGLREMAAGDEQGYQDLVAAAEQGYKEGLEAPLDEVMAVPR